jgi:hypothetical protein
MILEAKHISLLFKSARIRICTRIYEEKLHSWDTATPSPHKPTGVCFFDGMMYCGQLDQWYLIDLCILLALYEFQQRNELISFQISIKLMELLS